MAPDHLKMGVRNSLSAPPYPVLLLICPSFKSSGLSLGKEDREREWMLEVILREGLLKLRDSDQPVYWAPLRDSDII